MRCNRLQQKLTGRSAPLKPLGLPRWLTAISTQFLACSDRPGRSAGGLFRSAGMWVGLGLRGRDVTCHAGMTTGPAAMTVMLPAHRLNRWRQACQAGWMPQTPASQAGHLTCSVACSAAALSPAAAVCSRGGNRPEYLRGSAGSVQQHYYVDTPACMMWLTVARCTRCSGTVPGACAVLSVVAAAASATGLLTACLLAVPRLAASCRPQQPCLLLIPVLGLGGCCRLEGGNRCFSVHPAGRWPTIESVKFACWS